MLQISAPTLCERIKNDPELQALQFELKEGLLDFAEAKLIEQIKEGSLGAICFFLKCQGKGRGYVEKSAIDVNNLQGAGNLTIKIVADDGGKRDTL
jgi:hypothetical protein